MKAIHKQYKPIRKSSYLKLYVILIVSTALMITGYITVSENVFITRLIKISLRVSMALFVGLLFLKINNKARVNFSFENSTPLLVYLLYLLLGLCSLIWSSKASYSLLQWVMVAESLIFVWFLQKSILAYNFAKKKEIKLHLILAFAILLIILVFVIGKWVKPEIFYRLTHGGEVTRLGGYLMNPNELGMLTVVGLSMFLIEIKNRGLNLINVLSFIILFYALFITGSRSSLIGFFLVSGLFIMQSKSIKFKYASIAVALLAVPLIFNSVFIKEGDISEVINMTGRIPFWKALLNEGLPKQPIFGFGFMRIAEGDKFQSVHSYAGGMTHNTFIQVLLNLGFVGLLIVLVQVFLTIRLASSTDKKELRLFFFSIFIPIIINSFTEFGIFGEANFGILFWQLSIIQFTFKVKYSSKLYDRLIRRKFDSKKAFQM